MARIYIPLLLLFLFVIEGVAYDLIPETMLDKGWLIVAHWAFLFLILMALFYDLEHTYYSILAAIIIGLVTDIVYTDIIGVYMFAYGLVIYFVHGIRKVLHANFIVAVFLMIVGVVLADSGTSFVYSFIGVNNMQLTNYLLYRLLPTVIANMLAFIVLYLLFKNRLISWSTDVFDRKST